MYVAEPVSPVLPLLGYWPIWVVVGSLLIAGVVAWYLWAWWVTRRREEPVGELPVTPRPNLDEIRARALSQVAGVEARHARGELSERAAHRELSGIIREWAAEVTGTPTDRMTLRELMRTPFRRTTHTVAAYYPVVFGDREYRDVPAAAAAARGVITGWL